MNVLWCIVGLKPNNDKRTVKRFRFFPMEISVKRVITEANGDKKNTALIFTYKKQASCFKTYTKCFKELQMFVEFV